MMNYKTAITIAAAMVLGNASNAKDKQLEKLKALSPEHFSNTATVKNDELETVISITTAPGFKAKNSIFSDNRNDVYFRAFIEKASKRTLYQIAFSVQYRAPSWRFYRGANYKVGELLKTGDLTKLGTDVSCSGARYGGCAYLELTALEVSRPELDVVVKNTPLLNDGMWTVRLKSRHGGDQDMMISVAEIIGILDRVDKEVAKLPD